LVVAVRKCKGVF